MAFENRSLIITLLIFAAVIIGMSSFYAELQMTYGANKTQSLAFLNASTSTTQQIAAIQANLTTSSPASLILGVGYAFVTGAWSALLLTLGSVNIMTSLVTDTANATSSTAGIPIPAYIPGILIAIITVVILFAFFSAVSQRDI